MSTAQTITASSWTLEAEEKELKRFVKDPANVRDGAGIIAARRRLEDLPILIRSAQIHEAEREIERGRARMAELRREQAQAHATLTAYQDEHSAEAEELKKRLDEIGRGVLILHSEATSYSDKIIDANRSVIEAQHRLEMLGG